MTKRIVEGKNLRIVVKTIKNEVQLTLIGKVTNYSQ